MQILNIITSVRDWTRVYRHSAAAFLKRRPFAIGGLVVLILISYYYLRSPSHSKIAVKVPQPEHWTSRDNCRSLKPITSLEELVQPRDSIISLKLNEVGINGERIRQDDPTILKYFWDHCEVLMRHPDGKPTTYKAMGASMGQDEVVRAIFKNMTGGFFVEAGAYDGVTSSNTLELERDYGWQGLLIEAGKNELWKLHQTHRNAWISHSCVSPLDYPTEVVFWPNDEGNGQISRVIAEADNIAETDSGKIRMQCFPLYSFLAALNVTVVDFLSLDVEGAELQILKTIPFDKVLIKVIAVEVITSKTGEGPYREFMESKNFSTVGVFYDKHLPFDLIFAHNTVKFDSSVLKLLQPKSTGRYVH